MGSGRIFWHVFFMEFRLRFIQYILNYILPHVIHIAFTIYHFTAYTASSSSSADASLCTCPCNSVFKDLQSSLPAYATSSKSFSFLIPLSVDNSSSFTKASFSDGSISSKYYLSSSTSSHILDLSSCYCPCSGTPSSVYQTRKYAGVPMIITVIIMIMMMMMKRLKNTIRMMIIKTMMIMAKDKEKKEVNFTFFIYWVIFPFVLSYAQIFQDYWTP